MECRSDSPRLLAADGPLETIGFVASGGRPGRGNVRRRIGRCQNLVFGGCTVAKKKAAKKATKKTAKKGMKKK